uniref:NLR family, CARD domain containing 3-like 1 n=1 Tax=Cyprinus carpio TaxID=7962 RepID=A0A8C2GEC5_CYPCA
MDDDAVDMASDNSLPLGIGASAFGSENGDEEDVMPQRTLPFILGFSGPVGQYVERAESPANSYASMQSDGWSETREEDEPSCTQVQLYRRDSSASSSEEFNSDDEDINMESNLSLAFSFSVCLCLSRSLSNFINNCSRMLSTAQASITIFKIMFWNQQKRRWMRCGRNNPTHNSDLSTKTGRIALNISSDRCLEKMMVNHYQTIPQPIKIGHGLKNQHQFRGFTDDQKEAYFRKTIADRDLAEKVIAHIKSSKTLFIMCHLPLFCWVASKVLQQQFQSLRSSAQLPRTLTNLYTFMLHGHTLISTEKLKNDPTEETKDLTADQLLIKLAKLSYSMLEKNEFQIEKEHWDDIGLPDSYPAMACTGLCTEFYREKYMIYTEKVSCFAHPTIQEYLAALHVFYCFKKHGKNALEHSKLSKVLKVSLTDLLRSAVDKALSSKNSNYDIFLRFLLGLSVEANQELLKNILQISTSSSQNAREETTRYINKKIKEGHFQEKTENLLRCIDELNPQ